MRLLLVLPLALLFLAGCAKSDRDLLNGKWAIQEISANGEKLFATDKGEQAKIVDKLINKQMAQLPAEMQAQATMMREMMLRQMESMGKMTLEFKADGSYVASTAKMDGMQDTKGKLTFDEKKKELTLKSPQETQNLKYEFKEDQLILKITQNGETAQMIFKRA